MRRMADGRARVGTATAMVSTHHPDDQVFAGPTASSVRRRRAQLRPDCGNLPSGRRRLNPDPLHRNKTAQERRSRPSSPDEHGRARERNPQIDQNTPPLAAPPHPGQTAGPLATSPAVEKGQKRPGREINTAGRCSEGREHFLAGPSGRQDGASATRGRHAHARTSLSPHPDACLGSGELGKEVAIAAQRLGCRVIASTATPGAPAMQVPMPPRVIAMTDPEALKGRACAATGPILLDFPRFEALAVDALAETFEAEGSPSIPTARATAGDDEPRPDPRPGRGQPRPAHARFAYAGSAADSLA